VKCLLFIEGVKGAELILGGYEYEYEDNILAGRLRISIIQQLAAGASFYLVVAVEGTLR